MSVQCSEKHAAAISSVMQDFDELPFTQNLMFSIYSCCATHLAKDSTLTGMQQTSVKQHGPVAHQLFLRRLA